MLHSIEIEIDTNGYIHSPEPLPAGRRGILTWLDDSKIKQSTSNTFQDLFGILKSERGISLDEMEIAILQKARDRFDDCN
jgi:hypothetical protein